MIGVDSAFSRSGLLKVSVAISVLDVLDQV
jgi:hypothetical protein